MKNFLIGALVLSTAFYACGPTHVIVSSDYPEPAPAPQSPAPEVSYQSFYDELSPYGTWIDYPGYGYVWMPSVDPGFKPYSSDGHWVYTDEGWTWASDYNWGWATFHYGRWFYENGYGWMWKPGYEWAPAWVSWRRSPDYYGWAPLGPNTSVNISYSNYEPPNNYWSFVPQRYVNSPHLNNYYVNETKNVTIINSTTVINNNTTNNITYNNGSNNRTINNNTVNNNTRVVYANGPDPREVETATGTSVRPIAIRESSRPVVTQTTNGQLSIYRPRVNAAPVTSNNNGSSQRVAPARIVALRDIRPSSNNNAVAPGTAQSPSGLNATPANSTNPNQTTRPVNSFQQPPPAPNTNNPNPNQPTRPVNSFQQPLPAPSTNNPNPNQPTRPVNSFQQPPPPSGTNNPNPNQPARPFNRFQQPPVNLTNNNTNPNQNLRPANELQPANSRPVPVDRNTYPPVQSSRQYPPPQQNNQNLPVRPRLLTPANVNNNRVAQPQPKVQVSGVKPAPKKPVTQNPPPPDKKPKEEK
jgi:hypothetical protein